MENSRIAHAKINLALHVTGKRHDGYHNLDTLVCFAEIGDRLDIKIASEDTRPIGLDITGPFASDLDDANENLIIKAAHALQENLQNSCQDLPPVNIVLEKNLPVASGMGGGSADAAGALRLLKELWAPDEDLNLHEISARLGADVPMCLDDLPKQARGTGDELQPFDLRCTLAIVLVNPGAAISTPAVFDALKNNWNKPIAAGLANTVEQAVEILSPLGNDLTTPAISLAPEIDEVLIAINSQFGCMLSRMSGSGATCFGIFDNIQNAATAATNIKAACPQWWCVSTSTISSEG